MRRLTLAALWGVPAFAHVMSMSSGDFVVRGTRAHYELRMPSYEIAHIRDPESSLFGHIHFASGGREARLLSRSCHDDPGSGAYLCAADYEFSGPVDRLEVECTFHAVTVPNHVHLLRAERDGKRDQALFELSFPKATLRFAPPAPLEVAFTQALAGAGRACSLVELLFLVGLVIAARSRRELLALGSMFLLGQIATAAIVPLTSWYPAARFVEAATALTVAYLAVEVLLLPQAGARWLVAAVLGAFHGLYFALFLRTSEYGPLWVLAGAALAESAILALLATLFAWAGRALARLRPVPVCAALLLACGMGWFFARMAG